MPGYRLQDNTKSTHKVNGYNHNGHINNGFINDKAGPKALNNGFMNDNTDPKAANNGFMSDKTDLEAVVVEECPPYTEELEDQDNIDEKKTKKYDKYDISLIELPDTGPKWNEMNNCQRTGRVFTTLGGICGALGLLYIFICSLDILSASFQLLAGRIAGDALSNNQLLNNPIAGLVIGVIATVMLQSSSTSTSIVVTLVGAGVLSVEQAIYIVMGANIGTSVTNTIVALTQSMDREVFRRSFAGATVHDMFNWLTVIILLPLEAGTGYLYHMTKAMVDTINLTGSGSDEPEFLKVITDPLTKRIVKVDKSVVTAVAEGTDKAKYPVCKYYCDAQYQDYNISWLDDQVNETFVESIRDQRWTLDINLVSDNGTDTTTLTWKDIVHNESALCTHHFTGCAVEGTWCSLSDQGVGGILLACSLVIMLSAVIILVKLLGIILKGPMMKGVRMALNCNLPGKAKWLTGYIAILIGAGITILVQSSSVFTSTITPLVGLGLISVERMYPLTLGSNIGTTLTGILAALTADADVIKNTFQVAFAHLFFNITGILIFYPIPHMRKLPLGAAKFLGNVTAKYRWFAVAYLIVLFLIFPGVIIGLSFAGWQVLTGVLVPIGAFIIVIVIIKCMQHYCPQKMHPCMRNWHWLPKPLRSLEPCNNVVTKCCYGPRCVSCRKKCCKCKSGTEDDTDNEENIPHSEAVNGKSLSNGDMFHVSKDFQQDNSDHSIDNPAFKQSDIEHDMHTHL